METSFFNHVRELRKRLIVSSFALLICGVFAYFIYDQILAVLMTPLAELSGKSPTGHMFFVTSLFEGFVTRLKFSFIAGFIFSFPVHLYHFLRFILPALKKREKKLLILSLIASTFLAFFAIYLCYFALIPYSVHYLTTTDFIPNHVGLLLNFNQNIFYMFNFILYTMVIFQFPIVLELLMYLGLLKRKTLMAYGRFAVVVIFVVSGIITPGPDVISQIGVAIPMVILFYSTILIAKIFKFGEDTDV